MKLFSHARKAATLLFIGTTLSGTAMASNPCQSTYQSLESLFNAFNDDIIAMGCARSEQTDECKEKYLDGVTEALEIRDEYNAAADGPGTIGPRRFGLDNATSSTTLAGKVLAERVLIGAPIVARNFRFELKVTGGKSKKTLKVDVCMLDPDTMEVVGKKHFFDHTTLDNAKDIARTNNEPPHLERGFGNSTGLIPVMYLHKPAGLNSFQYQGFFQERGVPEVAKGGTKLISAKYTAEDLKLINKVLKNLPN